MFYKGLIKKIYNNEYEICFGNDTGYSILR
jgi:hypothetical protein